MSRRGAFTPQRAAMLLWVLLVTVFLLFFTQWFSDSGVSVDDWVDPLDAVFDIVYAFGWLLQFGMGE